MNSHRTASMEMPWLAHYEPHVPPAVEHQPACLHELLPRVAGRFPKRDAIILAVSAAGRLFHSSMTFEDLNGRVERFAASLQRLGVVKGDRVGLCFINCPQFVIAMLGAARAGAIAVPFNPLNSAREVEALLADSGAKVVVTLAQYYPTIKKAQPRTQVERVIVSRLKEHFPASLWLLYTLTRERKEPTIALAPEDLWFRDLLGPGVPTPIESDEEETAMLLYTGGTTGISKGVELSHRNLVVNAEQNRAWARIGDGCESALLALPLFHAFGLTCGLNLGLLTGATQILIPDPRDSKGLVVAIDRFKPTIFPVVPTLLIGISNVPGVGSYELKSVRVCPCAGSPLAPSIQRTFIDRTGILVCEGYGLTEAAPVTHGNPAGTNGGNRHGTIGVPYPGTLARVVSPETGEDQPFDGEWTLPGELLIKGPQVMKGYWQRPEETAAQLRDGWLHTGDLGQMHRDGYFRIVDRLKDMIIRGGLNVYPAEVETVLHEHPAVLEALVIGVPDGKLGERVKAFVVPRPGHPLTEEQLLAYCRDNLAKYKIPSFIELRSELPRSAVGKPLRRALREELAAKASEQGAA